MDEILDKLAADPGTLRNVTLAGPMLTEKESRWPLWILRAGAPAFGRKNVKGKMDEGIAVIADSAQFSTLITQTVPAHAVGTALTLQTSIGFLLTTISIQLVPPVVRRQL